MTIRKSIGKDITSEVRRRARFMCEAELDNRISLKQFAHIIPHREGGTIEVSNLIWLCESCHRLYEAQGKSGLMQEALIKTLEKFRDRSKDDNLVSGPFEELLSHPNQPIMIHLGSLSFREITTIFTEPHDSYRPSFLKFYRQDNQIKIEGHLKTNNGFPLIEFNGERMHFHTADIWDIERRPRYLKIYNKQRNIWVEIKQKKDLSVSVNGEIYAEGQIISISKKSGLSWGKGRRLSNFTLDGSQVEDAIGIQLQPSPIPRPYGHINPNVDL